MKDTMELLTDALLDMRSDALKARAEREAQELTVWEVRRIVPASFELGGVRPLPNGTGDITRPFPDQCERVSGMIREAREWAGKARAGYSTNVSRGRQTKMRQSRARRLLARSA